MVGDSRNGEHHEQQEDDNCDDLRGLGGCLACDGIRGSWRSGYSRLSHRHKLVPAGGRAAREFLPFHVPRPPAIAALTASPISHVETADEVLEFEAISMVRTPDASTSATARSMAAASAASPNAWRSIIAAERMVASGLATPFPAMSGAEPCMGS